MVMRFWSRSLFAASSERPAAHMGKTQPMSYTMSAMKHLENAVDVIVSAVTTPVANLKSALSGSHDSALSWYAAVLIVVFIACAMIAVLYNFRKSFKSLFRKIYVREDEDDEDDLLDDEDDDEFDEDEDDDESDDSDYSRGRGDRPTKKYSRSSYAAKSSKNRQKRRR